jgi:hypothetical protein
VHLPTKPKGDRVGDARVTVVEAVDQQWQQGGRKELVQYKEYVQRVVQYKEYIGR